MVFQIDGLPEAAEPSIKVSCSSPVEEFKLTLEDPVKIADIDPTTAILELDVSDADIPVGVSASIDVQPICGTSGLKAIDLARVALESKEISVEIFPKGEEGKGFDHSTDDATTEEDTTAAASVDATTTAVAICTVTLKLTYHMSLSLRQKNLRSMEHDLRSKKMQIIQQLRSVKMAASNSQVVPGKSGNAVKAGFLNNKQAKMDAKPKGFISSLYHSLADKKAKYLPILIKFRAIPLFVVTVILMHFSGDQLALPPII